MIDHHTNQNRQNSQGVDSNSRDRHCQQDLGYKQNSDNHDPDRYDRDGHDLTSRRAILKMVAALPVTMTLGLGSTFKAIAACLYHGQTMKVPSSQTLAKFAASDLTESGSRIKFAVVDQSGIVIDAHALVLPSGEIVAEAMSSKQKFKVKRCHDRICILRSGA